MVNRDEIIYKLDAVINYLKDNDGYEHKLYNDLCPDTDNKLDFNIVEYAEDVKNIIVEILDENREENIINNNQ